VTSIRLLGRSQAHLELLGKLDRVAGTDAEILISGPTGVGKELYARYAHDASRRSGKAFVAVNCGSIPPELFENELFGHRDGAYTGAGASQEGLVSEAEGGTLFLDEIDALPLASQVKLLRFVQQKEYRRLGDARIRRVDVRFVAATNADLATLIDAGRFRKDLYYRLCVFPLEIAPLCERVEDIGMLLGAYACHYSEQYQLPKIVLSPPALKALLEYQWPGNVRELENCVKYLTCLQLTRSVDKYDLPMAPHPATRARLLDDQLYSKPFTRARTELVSEFEKRYVEVALRKADGNITRAAEECGEYRKKISRLIKKHGIEATPGEHTN
jgi:two-component system, NtrC family, response regulator GlrR